MIFPCSTVACDRKGMFTISVNGLYKTSSICTSLLRYVSQGLFIFKEGCILTRSSPLCGETNVSSLTFYTAFPNIHPAHFHTKILGDDSSLTMSTRRLFYFRRALSEPKLYSLHAFIYLPFLAEQLLLICSNG